jgi:hypothetical protein
LEEPFKDASEFKILTPVSAKKNYQMLRTNMLTLRRIKSTLTKHIDAKHMV